MTKTDESEIKDSRPILPYEAARSVDHIFKDLEEWDLLKETSLFPGRLPQAHDMLRPAKFESKGEDQYGTFLAFVGDCCTYHAMWMKVKIDGRYKNDKIYIPDEKIEEVDALAWKYLKDQSSVWKKGKKQRMMVNAVLLPSPSEKNTEGMVKEVKIFDTDIYFVQKTMLDSKHYQDVVQGDTAIEFWLQEPDPTTGQTLSMPRLKFWPGHGLTEKEKRFYLDQSYALDSVIRQKLYDALDKWDDLYYSIEEHLKKLSQGG